MEWAFLENIKIAEFETPGIKEKVYTTVWIFGKI